LAPFFHLAYAVVIFLAAALVAFLPGWAAGLLIARRGPGALLPAAGIALAVWIWAGWLGPLYGISRLGLVLYVGVGALGVVFGWRLGLAAADRLRPRIRRKP
jgi:hypothetical protein